MSRPTEFSRWIAEEIIDRIYDGQTVQVITELDSFPTWPTLRKWLRQEPEFAQEYQTAYVASSYALADEDLQLSRDSVVNGKELSAVELQARKLLSESLWRHARARNPRQFGERAQVEHTHKSLPVSKLTDAELEAIARGAIDGSSRAIAAPRVAD